VPLEEDPLMSLEIQPHQQLVLELLEVLEDIQQVVVLQVVLEKHRNQEELKEMMEEEGLLHYNRAGIRAHGHLAESPD